MKLNKINKFFKKNKIKLLVFSILFILLIVFLSTAVKSIINSNFYCEIDTLNNVSLCIENREKINIFKDLSIINIIILVIIILKCYKKPKNKIIFSISFIILILLIYILSFNIYKKQLENNVLKSNDLKQIQEFYKQDKNKLCSKYEEKIEYFLKSKNIKESSDYLDSYDELCKNNINIKAYNYQIISLIANEHTSNISDDDYEKNIKYFEKLGDYKDSLDLTNKFKYNYAIKIKITENNYDKIIDILNEIKDYKDTKEKINEIKYNYAEQLESSNKALQAMDIYYELGEYKDSENKYNNLYNIHKYDGTWYGCAKNVLYCRKWIIYGDTCYNIYSDEKNINANKKYNCKVESDKLVISDTKTGENIDEFYNKDGNLIESIRYYGEIALSKTSDSVELPSTTIIKEPRIGMTASEVRASTWGEPKKINKSTYSWGTSEQWVYSNNRYIYFKNGKVTSISE